MIGYVTLGTNDLPRGARFYDAIADELGVKRMMEADTFIAWGVPGGGAGLGLTKPFDGQPATAGNGVMAALACEDKAQVDAVHKLAVSMGAKDEGAPGRRPGPPGFYAGYFRDLDGNKLNAFTMGEGGKSRHLVGYATMGTNNINRAAAFYDAIAQKLGATRVWEQDNSVVWSAANGSAFDLTKPFDGNPATVGNGSMVAFECKDKAGVDAVYNLARSLGAQDEGGPGHRGGGFYAAYFRDLDGNKLNAFVMG
jgi:catechol 2,3-dioxygenase-like lactoylglutathione lyase family enzyme